MHVKIMTGITFVVSGTMRIKRVPAGQQAASG
jgi:hypothetical protein